jgi:hydroxypyruvate isomerase
MRIKQSICYPILKPADMSMQTFVRAAAEIGYAGVEAWGVDASFEELVSLTRDAGMTVPSFIGHGSIAGGLNNRAEHGRIEEELHRSMDLAARSGVAGIICFSGNRRPGLGDEEAIDIIAEGLAYAAPYAERKGVNLNLELLNSKRDHVGYQCDRTSFAVAVCERVNSPRVKILYDIYHMQIMEGDVIETIRKNIRWIGHFHTAGNPGRKDMDDTQELNYRGICRAIAETNYDLYMGHEFMPKGDAIEALRTSFEMCDQG